MIASFFNSRQFKSPGKADKPDSVRAISKNKKLHRCSFIYPSCERGFLILLKNATNPRLWSGPLNPLFCLAPSWVYPACFVTVAAVGFYPTFSPLPSYNRSFDLSNLNDSNK